MNISVYPSNIYGNITSTSSKSLTHRYLICAAFCKKPSIIKLAQICDDTMLTIKALESIGVLFKIKNNTIKVFPPIAYHKPLSPIYCGNSGSTIRFLIPILATLFDEFQITGTARLIERLMLTGFNDLGLNYQRNKDVITIKHYALPTYLEVSDQYTSQYISGLLLCLPLLDQTTTIAIKKGGSTIDPYIDLTINVLVKFNIVIKKQTTTTHLELQYDNKTKFSPAQLIVEGDYSLMANFLVLGCFSKKGIKIKNLNIDSCQGDKAIISYLKGMGSSINYKHNRYIIYQTNLHQQNINIYRTPDLGPLLIGLCCVTKGKSIITGLEKLQYKESNRLTSTIKILQTMGADLNLTNKGLVINGKDNLPGGCTLDSYQDHRLVMMMIAISPKLINPINIKNIEVVNKSYPTFFEDLKKIHCHFEVYKNE